MAVFDTYRSAIGLYYGVLAGGAVVSSESKPAAAFLNGSRCQKDGASGTHPTDWTPQRESPAHRNVQQNKHVGRMTYTWPL